MFYHIHFDEDNCPVYDNPMSLDVFFVSENNIDLYELCKDVDHYKDMMDSGFSSDPLVKEYGDEGWHDKIIGALEILEEKHGYRMLTDGEMRTFQYDIN